MLGNKCFFQVVAVRARPWRNSLTDLAVVNAARPCTAYNLQIAEAKQQAGSWHVRSHPEGGFAEAAGKGYMIYHHFTVRVRLLVWVGSIAEGRRVTHWIAAAVLQVLHVSTHSRTNIMHGGPIVARWPDKSYLHAQRVTSALLVIVSFVPGPNVLVVLHH